MLVTLFRIHREVLYDVDLPAGPRSAVWLFCQMQWLPNTEDHLSNFEHESGITGTTVMHYVRVMRAMRNRPRGCEPAEV